jgi:hypothetical protein
MSEEHDADQDSPILQACPNCASLLDITEQEPFSQVHCPVCGTLMRVRTQFNNFTLEHQLGEGGMGAVYRALDVNLNRHVALKIVRREFSSDPAYIAKFEYEARITASINHPHVVKVFSFGSDHGLYYIAMELVDKGSLDDLLNLQGRVAEVQTLNVGIQIAQGLQAAFQRGLIHRDVKPGNILFADAKTAKIVDFGLALLMEKEAESRGEVWGTPYYVAPEKLNSEPEDLRSDIYSLGATMFHALAGRPPFEAESASLVALKHVKNQAVSLQAFAPDISSATAFVINRTLNKDPEKRYQTYDDLIEHLTYARNKLADQVSKPRQKARVVVESEEEKKVVAWVNLSLIAAVLLIGVALFVFRDRIFKKFQAGSVDQPVVQQVSTPAANEDEEKYKQARRDIVDGEYSSAVEELRELGEKPDLAQPLGRWITLHEGLGDLLSGYLHESRDIFKKLEASGMYSTEKSESEAANFFVNIGRIASGNKAIPPSSAKNFSGDNCEALALFIFALIDWQMSRFDDAGPILHAFLDANPQPPYAWIADYKPIAKKYADDFDAYKIVADKIKDADTAQKKSDALAALRDLNGKLLLPGKLQEKLAEMESDLANKTTNALQTEEKNLVAQAASHHARDSALLDAVKAKISSLVAAYQFDDALAAVQPLAVDDPDVLGEKNKLLKKLQWLVKFKVALIADINAQGYPQPVSKRSGPPIAGGTRRADKSQIQVQVPYGVVPVPWNEIAPASVMGMADYFTKKTTAPDAVADRTWLAGVFAVQIGMQKEGEALLLKASQDKADYRDQLPVFFDVAK